MMKRRKFSYQPFKEQAARLPKKQMLEARREKPPVPVLRRRAKESLSDEALFLREMADVTPLAPPKQTPLLQPPQICGLPDEESLVREELEALVRGDGDFALYYSDEYVEGAHPDLDPAILEGLRAGDFAWQAYLDLHGMRVDEAKEAVSAFVQKHQRMGHRCLLIVHGRGHHSPDRLPVLKLRLLTWLTRGFLRKQILAFASAPNHDGGAGALYIVLNS